MNPETQSPFNALPPSVIALAVIIGGLEAMFQLADAGLLGGAGGVGWRIGAIQDFGLDPRLWDRMLDIGAVDWDVLRRFATYPLLHGGAVEVLFAIVFVLALGKLVAEQFSQAAFWAIFIISTLAGGLGYVVLGGSERILIAAFPGAYGLIGAFTFILWMRLSNSDADATRAFTFIAILAGVQLLFSLFDLDFGRLVSDLSGFAAGFLLSFIVSPGGWARVLARLRQR
ncbi:MAG: rhomboid family intramembrane serine protease [Pseudomonadota bacterium]